MDQLTLYIVEFIEYIPKILVYVVISISSILQQWFPPYPGDTFAAVAGFFTKLAQYETVTMFLTFWQSTVVSSIGLFELGVASGGRIMNSKPVVRFFSVKKQERARKIIGKLGSWTFLICKFLPGINSIAILIGGTLGLKRRNAYIGIVVSSLIHNLLFFFAGRVIGNNMDRIFAFTRTYNVATFILLGIVGIAIITRIIVKHRRKKLKKVENQHENQ